MPIHDWTRVDAGIFHHFHQNWVVELGRALNAGLLSDEFYALVEQVTGEGNPDLLALQRRYSSSGNGNGTVSSTGPGRSGVLTLASNPPQVRFREQAPEAVYARKATMVVVRHTSDHRIVAMAEVVSPGNKSSQAKFRTFVSKAVGIIQAGVGLALLDLFPPSSRDPQGVHAAVWGELTDKAFTLPPDKPLTFASYAAEEMLEAFVDPAAVGDRLPALPLFLTSDVYVPLPLEATYMTAWATVPAYWQQVITG